MGAAPPPPPTPEVPQVPPPTAAVSAGTPASPVTPGTPVVDAPNESPPPGAPTTYAPVSQSPAANPYQTPPPSAKSGSLIYADHKVVNMESDPNQGIRSGAIAGVLTGLGFGAYHALTGAPIFEDFVGTGSPGLMVAAAVGRDFLLGAILGCILGMRNQLYFSPESTRTGLILGAVIGALIFLMGQGKPVGIVVAAFHGTVLGFLSSAIERRFFREE